MKKFKEEMNFTSKMYREMKKKDEENQMGQLEPALTIAKKMQHGVDEETTYSLIKKEQ